MLAQLSPGAFERLRHHLDPVELPLGTTIYEPGSAEDSLYFVSAGIASLLEVTASGSTAEIAVVGNEGVVGLEIFTGGKTANYRVVVQSAMRAFRLGAEVLQRELAADAELERHLLRFTEALIRQIAQTALCNRHHAIEQQLCRWLLASLDRLASTQLVMTHALIANMLGVRREGVTAAAGKLQRAGIIRYAHGRITVLDRRALELRACECYSAVRSAYERVLGSLRA
jgi:CRP-like cAMP-binding protein